MDNTHPDLEDEKSTKSTNIQKKVRMNAWEKTLLSFFIFGILVTVGSALLLGLKGYDHVYDHMPPQNITADEIDNMKCFKEIRTIWFAPNTSNNCEGACSEGCFPKLTEEDCTLKPHCNEKVACGSYNDWIDYTRRLYSQAKWLKFFDFDVICTVHSSERITGDKTYVCGYHWANQSCPGDYCQRIYSLTDDCNNNGSTAAMIGGIIGIGVGVGLFMCWPILLYICW
jgi:hypothetical protein